MIGPSPVGWPGADVPVEAMGIEAAAGPVQ